MNERIREFKLALREHKGKIEALENYQKRIRNEIIDTTPPNKSFNRFGGVDVSYDDEHGYAALVIHDAMENKIIRTHEAIERISFPYISTLFSFREGPIILKLFEQASTDEFDVLFLNGHGLMHPRLGLASHLGYLLDVSTIGIATSYLIGTSEEKKLKKDEHVKIFHENKLIGIKYQSQDRMNPIYISVGHKISLQNALELTQKMIKNEKMPHPLVTAHHLSNQLKSKAK